MGDFNTVFNCSIQKDFHKDEDLVNINSINGDLLETGAGFNTVTGIILVFFINVVIKNEHKRLSSIYTTKHYDGRIWKRILVLLILILLSPFIILFLTVALVYKFVCFIVTKWKDQNFVSFLDSFDVFWSLEDDATKSIINAFGIIESDNPHEVVERLKKKLLDLSQVGAANKIFYRRVERYGFYYWRKPDSIDISEYVQILDVPNKCGKLSKSDLEHLLTDISDRNLPFNSEGLFQVVITKQKVVNNEDQRNRHAIICRIHHSVGDGVTLIKFVCKTLADDTHNDVMDFTKIPESKGVTKTSPKDLIEMIKKISEIPISFADCILRIPDCNSLHGPKLIGGKRFKWTESDEELYTMVKTIKDRLEGVHFTDVLLAALSRSLHVFFLKTMDHIPQKVAIITPVRLPKVLRTLALENNFTVSILDLPINADVETIGKYSENLRNSTDSIINSGFIQICGILPKRILQPALESNQATMVFSNMPGPNEITICGGNKLKSLVFFVPNKGTTGLGVTALCYGDVLRLAACVDSALISDHSLGVILDGMVAEIKRLHTQCSTM